MLEHYEEIPKFQEKEQFIEFDIALANNETYLTYNWSGANNKNCFKSLTNVLKLITCKYELNLDILCFIYYNLFQML